jgi:hypothetical protein
MLGKKRQYDIRFMYIPYTFHEILAKDTDITY